MTISLGEMLRDTLATNFELSFASDDGDRWVIRCRGGVALSPVTPDSGILRITRDELEVARATWALPGPRPVRRTSGCGQRRLALVMRTAGQLRALQTLAAALRVRDPELLLIACGSLGDSVTAPAFLHEWYRDVDGRELLAVLSLCHAVLETSPPDDVSMQAAVATQCGVPLVAWNAIGPIPDDLLGTIIAPPDCPPNPGASESWQLLVDELARAGAS